ncbi:hypothetical protein ALC62_05338 [Cyphomyrmex costatus]|uniref:Uncharacterized protein n=1 Tax=Cyphomyrmex costatus TaxID=456900 RepID=A0A195CT53_9HYME|nr:hypothetical protein ALC62_05338 [Cyphomyrmex costatus]
MLSIFPNGSKIPRSISSVILKCKDPTYNRIGPVCPLGIRFGIELPMRFFSACVCWLTVLTISSSFCPYLDLYLACPCPDRCHDPVFHAIWICADDRGRDRDPCPYHGPGLCLSPDLCPVDLCLGDRDLEIVNVNASDVCSSYERKILQSKRFARNKTN